MTLEDVIRGVARRMVESWDAGDELDLEAVLEEITDALEIEAWGPKPDAVLVLVFEAAGSRAGHELVTAWQDATGN